MIEYFNFNQAYNNSYLLLLIWIPFFIVIFILGMITLVMLNYKNCKGRTIIFWVLFVVLCLPFMYNQIASLIVCVGLLLYLSNRQSIPLLYNKQNMIIILSSFTILFAFCVYVIISFIIYLYGTATIQDLWYRKYCKSIFIPLDKIPFKIVNKDRLAKSIKIGKQNAKIKKAVFGLLARDVAANFKSMQTRIKVLANHFQDYKIIIFENDSKDNTRQQFRQWQNDDKNVHLLDCCNFGDCECNLSVQNLTDLVRDADRMDKLRSYRQYLLDQVQQRYSDYDYYILIDFDLPGAFYLDGFFTSFENDDWDMQFARGITTYPMYTNFYLYDSFAFIAADQPFDYTDKLRKEMFAMNNILNNEPIGGNRIKCRSGFNGMAIYKIQSIIKCSYYNYFKKFKCEHIDLHHDMVTKGFDKIYFNPNMFLFAGHQGADRKKLIWEAVF